MRRTAALIVTVLVVGAVAVAPMAGAAQSTETPTDGETATDGETSDDTVTPTDDENATGDDTVTPTDGENATDNGTDASNAVAPGEQLAGVVGVQGAEIEGDVESRTFGVRLARAASDDSRADVVAGQVENVSQRLAELEAQRDALRQARENGSITEGEYRARTARLHAETRTVRRLANQSEDAAAGLPEETLSERGIDASAIRTLRDRANDLSGPETAAIARSIAGEGVGRPAGPAADGDRAGGNESRGDRSAGDGTESERPDGNESDRPEDGATDGQSAGDHTGNETERSGDTDTPDEGGQDDTDGQNSDEQAGVTATETDTDAGTDDGVGDGQGGNQGGR